MWIGDQIVLGRRAVSAEPDTKAMRQLKKDLNLHQLANALRQGVLGLVRAEMRLMLP